MDFRRFIKALLLGVIFITLGMLWMRWEVAHPAPAQSIQTSEDTASASHSTVPQFAASASASSTVPVNASPANTVASNTGEGSAAPSSMGQVMTVKTPLLTAQISLRGGNLVSSSLNAYARSLKDKQPFQLFSASPNTLYQAQSGLTDVSDSNDLMYQLLPSSDPLKIRLVALAHGLEIQKIYQFDPKTYQVHVELWVTNKTQTPWTGAFYGQLLRVPTASQTMGLFGSYTAFEGAALSSPSDHYQKQSYSDIANAPLQETITGGDGWAAMIQHYFVTAWIPESHQDATLYTQAYANQQYASGLMSMPETAAPGETVRFGANLYMGPAIATLLNQAAPHLSLTIDYGWLWFISDPIFSVMHWIHDGVGNWGLAIILVTLLIKLIFYPLSTKSYRSMAKMRKLQPKIAHLKERFGDDKQKLSQATMELYRSEKVNPLGGCLPMLIQIPVFIALYWVIMESVEFRQAPFIFWIHDLSVKDPFYILPVLMGLSMFIQQKLNPAPADPMQAKIMMFLPVIFTVLFSQFPSGLVLYWLFNNCFSILQQWWIMRRVLRESSTHPR